MFIVTLLQYVKTFQFRSLLCSHVSVAAMFYCWNTNQTVTTHLNCIIAHHFVVASPMIVIFVTPLLYFLFLNYHPIIGYHGHLSHLWFMSIPLRSLPIQQLILSLTLLLSRFYEPANICLVMTLCSVKRDICLNYLYIYVTVHTLPFCLMVLFTVIL